MFLHESLTLLNFFFSSVPMDISILRREHFNRWYSTSSYYLALSLSDYPVLIIFSLIYNILAYFMTGQPLESYRFMLVISISLILCFTAQAFGLFAGSMFDLTVSVSIKYRSS
jgi:ABC-2 type transporter